MFFSFLVAIALVVMFVGIYVEQKDLIKFSITIFVLFYRINFNIHPPKKIKYLTNNNLVLKLATHCDFTSVLKRKVIFTYRWPWKELTSSTW